MFARVLLTHPELGIYLGSFLGLGIWSKLDSAGQEHAVGFISKEQAKQYVDSWDKGDDQISFDSIELVPVLTADDMYATIAECEAAGLEAWTVEEYTVNVESNTDGPLSQQEVSGVLH